MDKNINLIVFKINSNFFLLKKGKNYRPKNTHQTHSIYYIISRALSKFQSLQHNTKIDGIHCSFRIVRRTTSTYL